MAAVAMREGGPSRTSSGRGREHAPLPSALSASPTALQLWPAWRTLADWEEITDWHFGDDLGDLLLTLWTLYRLGGTGDGEELLMAEADAVSARVQVADEVLQDMARVCFSIGVSWASESVRDNEGRLLPLPNRGQGAMTPQGDR